jgi:hypothetical protein
MGQSYLDLNNLKFRLGQGFGCTNRFEPSTKLVRHFLMTVWLGEGIKDGYKSKRGCKMRIWQGRIDQLTWEADPTVNISLEQQ